MSPLPVIQIARIVRAVAKLVPVPDPGDTESFYQWLVDLTSALEEIAAAVPGEKDDVVVAALKKLIKNKEAAIALIDLIAHIMAIKQNGRPTTSDTIVSIEAAQQVSKESGIDLTTIVMIVELVITILRKIL